MSSLKFINLSQLFLLFTLISAPTIYSQQLRAEDLKTIWSTWNECPSNHKKFQQTQSDFDQKITKYFSSKTSEELNEIYNQDHPESATLRLFTPFLVVPASQAHFDKQCWVIFKDFSTHLTSSNKNQARVLREQWLSCLAHYYRQIPDEALKISKCYESLK